MDFLSFFGSHEDLVKKTLPKPIIASSCIPLCKPYITAEEEKAVAEVLRSGWLMQGPKVEEFERLVAEYAGVKHAVSVNSGTSALTIAYAAAGLPAGRGAIMPSHSFVATANTAVHNGLTPIFVDIKRNQYNIDPSKIEPAISKNACALVVVHQIGIPADMTPIMKVAKKHKLVVLEDAACSIGATYGGRQTGGFGEIACLSFHPRKVITTGEGGMLLTNSDQAAQLARSLRNHGLTQDDSSTPIRCKSAGYNYRMTDVQAAIGIVQFKKLDEIIRLRTRLAARYQEEISRLPALRLPEWPKGAVPNFQSFVVEALDEKISRDLLLRHMNERGIESKPGIQPIHNEPAYAGSVRDADLPETMRAAGRSFFLPLYPGMTDDDQTLVLQVLKEATEINGRAR
ncbi:MAG: DegT/DnrJ/EryC1/StrS family aminotransferase [Candidatus Abyssobacteria bacterium SURF_5]|uniref:DegT/DnrJ/EryC1/StrS family aminotransferase n=1 Tax=Abyssobacteria bacterium (strain SURF_5) TaxID=2093360 RepID=A0A3A4P3C2_ABYX5|nr:MAG: DegT/DnrJ/EryC1/StrS family aminotransferase [Candidatus Abyssubacteria bacterium SURF_5]